MFFFFADVLDEDPRVKINKNDKNSEGKVNTQTVKLNNNQMSEMTGLDTTLIKIVEFPEDLTWIDLSFNDFSKIDPVSSSHKLLIRKSKSLPIKISYQA